MISKMSQSGHTTYGLTEFVIDTEADLDNLPITGVPMGSVAFVIETSALYMINSKGEWKEV